MTPRPTAPPLYTPEQRLRRDATVWTLVQGVLAPLQFLVFAVSAVLVSRAIVNLVYGGRRKLDKVSIGNTDWHKRASAA